MIDARKIRHGLKFLAVRFRELRPLEVEAAVLNTCNLRCRYCLCPDTPKDELTTGEWVRIVEGFASLGTIRFKLHGGEPTLRADFGELCSAIRGAGMISCAVTNGTRIPKRPRLLDQLDEVVVSLDSPIREHNDENRGMGSYDGAVRTIELARERGISTYVNVVLTKSSLADLDAMMDFCEERGIAMNAQPIVFGARYYDDRAKEFELSDEQIRRLHHKLIAWKRAGRGVLFSEYAYRKALEWPDYDELTVPAGGGRPCPGGREYIRVEANGDVIPCCQYRDDFTPRNALRDGLVTSLRHVKGHRCGDCWLPYYNERAALFRLRPSAIIEAVKRV